MKAFLMHRECNFEAKADLPENSRDLIQDLELETLISAMANDDEFLTEIARSALLQASRSDLDTVLYRQAVLEDCLRNSITVRAIYKVTVDSLEAEKKHSWAYASNYPAGILRRSLEVLHHLVELLSRLRGIADKHSAEFRSEGFTGLFATLRREMDDDYFAKIRDHLQELKFENGVLIGACLGKGNKGCDHVLLRSKEPRLSWLERLFAPKRPGYTFTLHPRDEGGARALSELSDRGISLVANALAQSTVHIVSFFAMLRNELAFYMGCLNLSIHLEQKGALLSFPEPSASNARDYAYVGLYDVCLALKMEKIPVSNNGDLRNSDIVFITGANQGGKSTFLRSVGVAQLMMQAGMFVPALALASSLCEGLFTHYKREEDTSMRSGKFDEELVRMSKLVDRIRPHSLILFNESFAATNEREGSEIATQIVKGLLVRSVRVFFVTHMYELASSFFGADDVRSKFLRAERQTDGSRSFKLTIGEPLRTSYGRDLFEKTFAVVSRQLQVEKPRVEDAEV
ncbi:MAG: MutS-related protein [Bradyrhizobium sp.]